MSVSNPPVNLKFIFFAAASVASGKEDGGGGMMKATAMAGATPMIATAAAPAGTSPDDVDLLIDPEAERVVGFLRFIREVREPACLPAHAGDSLSCVVLCMHMRAG